MSEKYNVAIIGAGLGGLECGLILAKHGLKVCVLEKNPLIGGCLQTFRRGKVTFDTGFHYVGGLDEGQMLHTLFDYLGLLDLPWQKMDTDCFDEVVIGDEHYKFASGYEKFQQTLSDAFPHQRENIARYVELLRKVGDNINHSFDPRSEDEFYSQSLFAKSAYDYLRETFTDDRLIDVVSGTSLKMELNAEKLPLYTFAQINSSFIQSAYRLQGGGMQIAEKLCEQIESLGGKVRKNARVTSVVEDEKQIRGLVINGDENDVVEADIFISNLHPAATLNCLSESKLIRKVYRNRINSLENTFGAFTVNLALKKDTIKYINRNIYAYRRSDIWHLHSLPTNDVEAILINVQPPADNSEYTDNIDILTPMNWSDVEKWNGTKVGRRGADYEALKAEMAEKCIDFASQHISGLREAIDKIYTSTPLTYSDYTATPGGSAYGIRKDYSKLMFTVLTPRTPIPNLLLTGQCLNLHGILGVSMTSIFTCAEILGMQKLVQSINKKH